jgi:hypothetical protein
MTLKNPWAIKHESEMLIFFKIKYIYPSVVVDICGGKETFLGVFGARQTLDIIYA